MTGTAPRIGVVILNWNDAPSTLACVESVARSTLVPSAVVVVDNGSEEACYRTLRSAQPSHGFHLVRSEVNLGYGAGNNLGIRRLADADFVLVLNNDTVVQPSALAALVEALADHPTAGIATPLAVTEHGRVWFAGGDYRRWRGVAVHHGWGRDASAVPTDGCRPVGFASGCALLVRQDVFRSVGLIHESFFLYWEDVELSRRVTGAGWTLLFCPHARIVHNRGDSPDLSPTLLRYQTRNRLMYLRSFERGLPRVVALLYTVVDTAASLRRLAALRGVDRRARSLAVLRGLYEGLRLPRLSAAVPSLPAGVPVREPVGPA